MSHSFKKAAVFFIFIVLLMHMLKTACDFEDNVNLLTSL